MATGELRLFYHAYLVNIWTWQHPVQEQLQALIRSGFADRDENSLSLTLIGTQEYRDAIQAMFEDVMPLNGVLGAEEGWEQLTLDAILGYAADHGGSVIYAHTKGAASPMEQQAPWRHWMTEALVVNWRLALEALESGRFDAAGPHWATQELFGDREVPKPCFVGNFWAATCEYLRTLPVCDRSSRYEAEVWIGQNLTTDRVFDMLPGWPPGDGLPGNRRA